MTDDRRGWAAVPPPLLLAIALRAAVLIFLAASSVRGGRSPAWFTVAQHGLDLTATVLLLFGLRELAGRHRGVAQAALVVAALSTAAQLGLQATWMTRAGLGVSAWPEGWQPAVEAAWYVVDLATTLGLVVAVVACGHRGLALGCAVLALATRMPPGGWDWLAIPLGTRQLLSNLLEMAQLALLVALVPRLAALPAPPPWSAARGLRHATLALRLRIAAFAVASGTVGLVAMSRGATHAVSVLRALVIAGEALGAVSLAWLALGLLAAARASSSSLSQMRVTVAAACLLWAGAASGFDVLQRYAVRYTDIGIGGGTGGGQLAFCSSVVLAIALVGLCGALGAMAARRGAAALRQAVRERRTLVGVLLVGAAALKVLNVAHASADGGGALLVVSIAVFVAELAPLMMVSRICALAAEALAGDAPLPAARVVAPNTPR